MEPDQYTHNFKFFVGKHGENTITGDCEFDSDNKMTFKIKETSDPLPAETMSLFLEYMNLVKRIYEAQGGVRIASIVNKEIKNIKELEKVSELVI